MCLCIKYTCLCKQMTTKVQACAIKCTRRVHACASFLTLLLLWELDEDATDLPVQDRHIGFVFQNFALFNHMTVGENIRFGMKMRKLDVDPIAR